MISRTLLATRPVYRSFSRNFWPKQGAEVQTASWGSDFWRHLITGNILLAAFAYYVNTSVAYGSWLEAPKERNNPLEV